MIIQTIKSHATNLNTPMSNHIQGVCVCVYMCVCVCTRVPRHMHAACTYVCVSVLEMTVENFNWTERKRHAGT